MKKTVLFDIDGTLADISHRRHFVEGSNKDWNAFFEAMGEDTPNAAITNLYRLLWDSDQYDCFLVSGRPERYRTHTEQWLVWNDIPYKQLLMRPANDTRADHLVKEEILLQLKLQGRVIEFVVDDRQSVVDMWRRNGVTCLQCDDYQE